MAKDTTPQKPQTPWEKFTEVARNVLNAPKEQVQKTIKKYPSPHRKSKRRKSS